MDYSTIALDLLGVLPTFTAPPGWHLQASPGNGCAGDAPGFPTYFTRNIYTSRGETPHRGPQMVISHEGINYVVDTADDDTINTRAALLQRLWRPLPFDHPRVQAWVRETYRHHASCYRDDDRIITEPSDYGMFIYPVPSYKLRTFQDDERFSEDWRTKERAAVAAYNYSLTLRAMSTATPANHSAHRLVAKFYPEATPRLDLIATPPTDIIELWWETEAERPTPETCQPRSCGPHPVNKTWCQWCGWRDAEPTP